MIEIVSVLQLVPSSRQIVYSNVSVPTKFTAGSYSKTSSLVSCGVLLLFIVTSPLLGDVTDSSPVAGIFVSLAKMSMLIVCSVDTCTKSCCVCISRGIKISVPSSVPHEVINSNVNNRYKLFDIS